MKEKNLQRIKEEAEEQLDTDIVSIEYVGVQVRETPRDAPTWMQETKLERIWRRIGFGTDSEVIWVFKASTPRLQGYLHKVSSGGRVYYEFLPSHIRRNRGITS